MKNPPKKDKPLPEIKVLHQKKTSEKIVDNDREIGGQKGPEPTRYGDWEKGGRCTDF